MSLFKRKGSTVWWCDYTKPNGERVRESTRTQVRKDAAEYEVKRKTEAWRTHALGEKPRRTWQEAVVKYLEERVQAKSLATIKGHLKWLDPHLGERYLDEIDSEKIASIRRAKAVIEKDDGGNDVIRNPATVNRMLEVLQAVLRKAWKEWEWLDRIPHFPMYEEPKGRVRWITPDDVKRLMNELPEHQRAMALFDLSLGVRQANVRLLEWEWVDLEKKTVTFPPYAMKGNEWHTAPLNEGALFVLEMQRGMHKKFVFPYRGKPVGKVSTRAWRDALARAGIKNFHWHDLRHTWASWLRQNGVPLDVVQQLGGWRSSAMTLRYAHLDVSHLAEHAARLPNLAKEMMEPVEKARGEKSVRANAVTQSHPVSPNVVHVTFTAQSQK